MAETERKTIIARMTRAIAHRGPDADGAWIDDAAGVGLGHRRLSVIDLTSAGAQPMISRCGRYIIVYNGEIYGFKALRETLSMAGYDYGWRGDSDTEVLLAAFTLWGVDRSLPALDGMFAFAVWDLQERSLTLARDRFGEKPLYYGLRDGMFGFASELRPLTTLFRLGVADIDPASIDHLFQRSCIPAPISIFRGVAKLAAAHSLTLSREDVESSVIPEAVAYWDPVFEAGKAAQSPFQGNMDEAVDAVEQALGASVSTRLVADVPVGVMLSGGVDSTCVAALSQARSSRRLHTYTIGFEEAGYDESAPAQAVAKTLGTEHETLRVTDGDAIAAVADLPDIYDEPFADSSQVATLLLCRQLRRKVTVALAGDGGDELFGGYMRHIKGPRYWSRLSSIPRPFRVAAGGLVQALGSKRVGSTLAWLSGSVGGEDAGRIQKVLTSLGSASADDFLARLTRHWPDGESPACSRARGGVALLRAQAPDGISVARWMMLNDVVSYLPDDILTKVDRASMSVALETRAPFLDAAVATLAWSLPTGILFRGGAGKAPLRRLAERYVPPAIMDRPKQGFAIPYDAWLRGPLREWGGDLLAREGAAPTGLYDIARVGSIWREHQSGAGDHAARLWPVLMLEAWKSTLAA